VSWFLGAVGDYVLLSPSLLLYKKKFMKVIDFISKSIQEYPSLWKDKDYQSSKLKVLDHVFFTIGNGFELAETGNPETGGYAVEPKFKKNKKTDEWVRLIDKPYGKEKASPLPNGYFESTVFYESNGKKYTANSLHSFSPYPFSKDFSIVCDVFYDDVFLQQDWMQELVILCERTLEYFQDENQYKHDTYYPTGNKIQSNVRYFEKCFVENGQEGLKELRKIWGYEPKSTVPDFDEVQNRKNDSWNKFHKKQVDFLQLFLKKYSN
jgi:hypothetical protein